METSPDWSAQQLGEFLAALCSAHDEQSAIDTAIERAAEAVECEVGCVVLGGRVVSSVGFPPGAAPIAELARAAAGNERTADLPGLGACAKASVPLDEQPLGWLLVGRIGEPFSHREVSLLRGMGKALTLTTRMLRLLEAERLLRHESQQQEERLRHRQLVFERMLEIQRLISSRAALQVVFDAVANAASTLFGGAIVGLTIIDPADPTRLVRVAARGEALTDVPFPQECRVGEGVIGQAVSIGRLVASDDRPTNAAEPCLDHRIRASMAAPVTRDGTIVGSLGIGSTSHDGRFESAERDLLLAFAEHVSLALNDDSAVRAIHDAYDAAVHRATHDSLTGLPNRALVLDRLEHALARTARTKRQLAVLFVDLDRFKAINDSLGHSVGDEVLTRVAERLQTATRDGETVGRLSGDEFVVICEEIDTGLAVDIAERLASAIAEPFSLYGRDTTLTPSIGIALSAPGSRAEGLLRDADVAMYRAKERGRARVELFDETMRTQMLHRIETEQALRRAIRSGELVLHYQPTYSLGQDVATGVEALVRWDRPGRPKLTMPDEFITLAEDTGLIIPLGSWVLDTACRQMARWRRDDPKVADLCVSVNLSGSQFSDHDLVRRVEAALDRSALPAAALCLEITESVVMEDASTTVETLLELRQLGVQLAIDDFGTGYSSLSYLRRFPVDAVKIDRSFVEGLGVNPDDDAIVAGVIGLAHALRLSVVAEGVENDRQLAALKELSCDVAQGYLLGRPMPADEIPDALGRSVVALAPNRARLTSAGAKRRAV